MTKSQSPWQSNSFLFRLQTAAKSGYIPRTRRPKKLRHPRGKIVGQLSQPSIGFDDLTVDLIAEKLVLENRHGRSTRALGHLHRALGSRRDPRRLKPATVGRIGVALAKHARTIAELDEQIAAANRRIELVAKVRDVLVFATLAGWETFGSVSIGENGKIYAEEADSQLKMPFPQDHPVVQAGAHLALILADDDRAEFTGIRSGVLPFAETARGNSVPLPAGEAQVVGTITDDILKRVAALARALSETVVHEGLSLDTLELAELRLNVTANTRDTVRDIFWALAAELHPSSAGKELELKPDWTIVEKAKPGILASILSEFFGGGGGSDGGGLAEMLAEETQRQMNHFPPGFLNRLRAVTPDCGDSDCPLHGNGNGRHPASRKRAPVGARG